MKYQLLYQLLHKRLCNEVNCALIEKKFIYERMAEVYKVPKPLRSAVLKEMINLKMFKEHNRDLVEILPVVFDPEENPGMVYINLGMCGE